VIRPPESRRSKYDDDDNDEHERANRSLGVDGASSISHSDDDPMDDGSEEIQNVDPSTHDIANERTHVATFISEDEMKLREEMRHLLSRIKRLRESIQLSSAAITNPTTYERNVLNVVTKCYNEYHQILRHHRSTIEEIQKRESEDPAQQDANSSSIAKAMSLPMFELIQHSVQCGPLTGSNAGYFKRCGSDVAGTVQKYLNTITDELEACNFTEKQTQAITKWKQNAEKAASNAKPPSKSALRKQQQAAAVVSSGQNGKKKQGKKNGGKAHKGK